MKQQLSVFIIRWLLNSFGLWLAIVIFGTGISDGELTAGFWGFLLAGFIFSVVNSVLRPVVIILSLPAILLTLGLFTLVVNGFMVWLSLKLAPGIQMTFLYSILTGMLLSLINYIVSSVFELHASSGHTHKKEIL
ncbi:MAG TPA: phage holin family protein [Candidatus Saccharimonadales bacterium]